MSIQSKRGTEEVLPEDAVVEYLRDNPDFFARNEELTASLRIPHDCGDAISLLEYQSRVLRDENRLLTRRLDDLLQVARDNDRLSERLHALTLELMDSRDLETFLEGLKAGLRAQFQADAVALRLFDTDGDRQNHPDFVAPDDASLEPFQDFINNQRPRCGLLTAAQLEVLFGETAPRIASGALIPVVDHGMIGILSIGSFQGDRFHASQGTVFLKQLGELTGRAVRRHLAG